MPDSVTPDNREAWLAAFDDYRQWNNRLQPGDMRAYERLSRRTGLTGVPLERAIQDACATLHARDIERACPGHTRLYEPEPGWVPNPTAVAR